MCVCVGGGGGGEGGGGLLWAGLAGVNSVGFYMGVTLHVTFLCCV